MILLTIVSGLTGFWMNLLAPYRKIRARSSLVPATTTILMSPWMFFILDSNNPPLSDASLPFMQAFFHRNYCIYLTTLLCFSKIICWSFFDKFAKLSAWYIQITELFFKSQSVWIFVSYSNKSFASPCIWKASALTRTQTPIFCWLITPYLEFSGIRRSQNQFQRIVGSSPLWKANGHACVVQHLCLHFPSIRRLSLPARSRTASLRLRFRREHVCKMQNKTLRISRSPKIIRLCLPSVQSTCSNMWPAAELISDP